MCELIRKFKENRANNYKEIRMHFIGTNNHYSDLSFFYQCENSSAITEKMNTYHTTSLKAPHRKTDLRKIQPTCVKNTVQYTVKYGLIYRKKAEN